MPDTVRFAILCDDVRMEQGGKFILIGIFDSFRVIDFTQPLPPFHIFLQLSVKEEGHHSAKLRLASEQGDFSAEIQGQIDANVQNDVLEAYICNVNFGLGGLKVPRPGKYHVFFQMHPSIPETAVITFGVISVQPPHIQ